MTEKLVPACAYQGGKSRIAKEIVDRIFGDNIITDETQFYDLCCGSGSISIELINRGIKPHNITMLDRSVWGELWNEIGNGTFEIEKFNKYIDEIPKDPDKIQEHIKALYKEPANIDTVYKFLLLQTASFGSKAIYLKDDSTWATSSFRNYWTPTATSSRRSPVNPMMPMPNTLRKRVETLASEMKGVNGINDSIESLTEFADDAIIYIDPPYQNTSGYGYNFDIHKYIKDSNRKLYISEGYEMAKEAYLISAGRSKGGISGERKKANEEWLNVFNQSNEVLADVTKEYEVNFVLSGNYLVSAKDEEEAREIVNQIINDNSSILEDLLKTGLKDDDYTTDVIELSD